MAKTLPTDTIVIGIAVVWALLLPYFPDTLFMLLDSLVGVFFLLLVVLFALPQGAVPGILVVVAVALTFVERTRRKIQRKIIEAPILTQQLAPAPPMSPYEVHPAFEHADMSAEDAENPFMPEENASDKFQPVGVSIDEKNAIPTISSNTDSAERFFIRNSLAKTELE